ncbi:MAG: hypothetical protein ACOX2F_07030 [bacterium]
MSKKPYLIIGIFILITVICSCNTTAANQQNSENSGDSDNSNDSSKIENQGNTGNSGNDSDSDSDTGNSDNYGDDREKPSGGEITKIQKGEVPLNSEVSFESVIVGIVYNQDSDFESTNIKGLYVSEIIEKALPYSGIFIFIKDTVEANDFSIGDKIFLSGKYKNHFGSSQVEVQSSSISKLGTAKVPEPAEVDDPATVSTPFELSGSEWVPTANHGSDAEKYESVLIKISNVEITNTSLGHGAWEVSGSLAIDKEMFYYSGKKDVGKKFSHIEGVLIYSFDAFKLAPRMVEDIVEDKDDTGDTGNTDDTSNTGDDGNTGNTDTEITITKIQRGEVPINSEVSLQCVVTGVTFNLNEAYEPVSIKGLYLSEIIDKAAPYTGIYLFVKGNPPPTDYRVGDKLSVTGIYKKFYGSSQIEANKKDVERLGTAKVPDPVEIDDPATVSTPFELSGSGWIPTANHGSDAEKYESVLIKVSNVKITNSNLGYGTWEVTGNLVIDREMFYYFGKKDVGKRFSHIQGILIYTYDAFKLAPRMAEDVVENF